MGFAVRNTLLRMIEPPTDGTERLLTLRLSTVDGLVNLGCVNAPTLNSPGEVKDECCESLHAAIGKIPSSEHVFLHGDFNARVGADRESWPSILGHHGIGEMNENGQRLLELCCYHSLCVTNTFFQNNACHKVSWRRHRSNHWHQLDFIITRHLQHQSLPQCRLRHWPRYDCLRSEADTKEALPLQAESLRSRGADPPTRPGRQHLPRVPLRHKGREINSGHDFLRTPTTGEIP